jgi:uncharacterized membrane protein YccF (DUF307 family)
MPAPAPGSGYQQQPFMEQSSPYNYPPPSPQQYNPQQPPVVVQNYYQTPMQPPMPYMQPQPSMQVNVNVTKSGPGFVMRALWFLFIGWWVGFWWLNVGYLLCVSIVLLPFGLMMLNRLPAVLTLKSSDQQTNITVTNNAVNINIGGVVQKSFLIRAIYFLLVGWWAGGLWAYLGYCCCVSIVLLPVGLMMLNRLPLVLTLRQG